MSPFGRINLLAIFLFAATTISFQAGARTCESLFNESVETISWFRQIDFRAVENTLMTAKVIAVKPLKEALDDSGKQYSGSTEGMLVITFAEGTQALWKPGKPGRVEAAAYKAARRVRSRLPPPTVFRTFDRSAFSREIPEEAIAELSGKSGSLQYFVKTPSDLTRLKSTERERIWSQVPDAQKAERDIYNFVFGNWDLHWGNILVDASYSIAQIDLGVIRSRLQVQYGKLPFVRRMSMTPEIGMTMPPPKPPPFPFAKSIHLNKPSFIEFIELMQPKAVPNDLANYVYGRLAKPENPPEVIEALRLLIKNSAHITEIQKFLSEHPEIIFTKDFTMRIVFWDRGIWIQGIGFQNYGPVVPPVFPKRVIAAYRKLTYKDLREDFPEDIFSDTWIYEALGRRDQILKASDATQKSAGDSSARPDH